MPYADPEIRKQKAAERYQRNREKMDEQARQWRMAHPERAREMARKSAKANRERRKDDPEFRAANRAREKAWKEAHPERWRDIQNASQARHYDRHIDNEAVRRARKRGAFVERVERETVYRIHGGRCGICSLFINGPFHVDHVIPLVRGGAHSYANTQPAHPRCNSQKGGGLP